MTESWDRIEILFQKALDLAPEERGAFLDAECGEDEAFRAELESLLAADEQSGSLVEKVAEAQHGLFADMEKSRVSTRVGPYELLEILGHGGMGTVYLAERVDDEYEAKVAMKFLRAGPALPDVARRLRSERQILANLNHPNIARLLDGGATPDGSPYLVMEYVDGTPIDRHCDAGSLGVRERLELFRTVCAAVQHAHQGLVVHRDLKPANILVTEDGTPKLLDFGIAKLLDEGESLMDHSITTQLMTPSFASPEQILGEPVSVATDVYSLGAILYVLLTGRPPFEPKGLSAAELTRRICTEEVQRPSLAAAGERRLPSVARGAQVSWIRHLRGDLDTILTTALAKDPKARYESVAALADDVRRHLRGEPILARPQTPGYRLRKFARRHPVGLAGGVAFALTVTGFSVLSTLQAQRLAEERDRAEQGEAAAEHVSEFLVGLFEVSDPGAVNPDSVSARAVLDRGAQRIASELADQPEVRAELVGVLGRVYRNLGLFDEGSALLDTALVLKNGLYPPDHPEVMEARWEHAENAYLLGDYETAESLHREVLEVRRSVDATSPGVVQSLTSVAAALAAQGRVEDAEPLYIEALSFPREDTPLGRRNFAADLVAYGDLLRDLNLLDSAAVVIERAATIQRAELGDHHIELAHSLNQLSRTYSLLGENERALPLAEEGLAIRRGVYGPDHPEVGASLGNLSGILSRLDRLDEAETARLESLASLRAVYGDTHHYIAGTLSSLGSIQLLKEDFESSAETYRLALEKLRSLVGEKHPNLAFPLTGLGQSLNRLGRAEEAEPFLREAVAVRLAAFPDDHWQVAFSRTYLGESLLEQGRVEEALPLLEQARGAFADTFGEEDRRTKIAEAILNRAREAGS